MTEVTQARDREALNATAKAAQRRIAGREFRAEHSLAVRSCPFLTDATIAAESVVWGRAVNLLAAISRPR
jgi:hypothetical protein